MISLWLVKWCALGRWMHWCNRRRNTCVFENRLSKQVHGICLRPTHSFAPTGQKHFKPRECYRPFAPMGQGKNCIVSISLHALCCSDGPLVVRKSSDDVFFQRVDSKNDDGPTLPLISPFGSHYDQLSIKRINNLTNIQRVKVHVLICRRFNVAQQHFLAP